METQYKKLCLKQKPEFVVEMILSKVKLKIIKEKGSC